MSLFLYENAFGLNVQTAFISGVDSNLAKTAPIITQSNVVCSNLHAEFADYCLESGNVMTPFPFTIDNSPQNEWILVGTGTDTATWDFASANYLRTNSGLVSIFGSNAPAVNDVLIATSATTAAWGPQSGTGTSSNVAAFLQTTGANVNVSLAAPPLANQYLKTTSPTTAVWANVVATTAVYADSAGTALHANIADLANIATYSLDGLHCDWADTANLAGFAVDATHSDFADFANSIPNTTVVPGVYGDATHVGKFTVNATGQLTQAANVAISFPSVPDLTGPVTSIGAATTITPTTVTPGLYGDTTHVGKFTVNAAGQLTQAANVAISFPSVPDLTGPVTSIGAATTITPTTVTPGLYGDATHVGKFTVNAAGQLTQAANVAISFPSVPDLTGPVTSIGAATTITPTTVTPASYGDATNVATFTVNAAGQLTTAASTPISFPAAGDLTGPITSVGLATSIASQTGTGSTFVVDTSPTLITPVIGAATGTSLSVSGQLTSTVATGTAPLVVSSTTLVPNLYTAKSVSSDTISTLTSTSTSAHYPTFVSATANSSQQTYVDSGLTYKPGFNLLETSILTLNSNNAPLRFTQSGNSSTFVMAPSPAADRRYTLKDLTVDGDFVITAGAQTLTSKTATDNTNNLIARELWFGSGSGSVSTYAATTPKIYNTLVLNSATTAAWGPARNPVSAQVLSTVTAAGTSVLTVNSPYFQRFTGTTTQIVTMPAASVMTNYNAVSFNIFNHSTGTVTVKANDGSTILAQATKTSYIYLCYNTGGDTSSVWTYAAVGAVP